MFNKRNSLWFSDSESLLIDLIQQNNFMWDVNHPDFNRSDIKKNCFREIASFLGDTFKMPYTDETVKARWKRLKATFLRNLTKLKNDSKAGRGSYKPKWPWWDRLKFLVSTDNQKEQDGFTEVNQVVKEEFILNSIYDCANSEILGNENGNNENGPEASLLTVQFDTNSPPRKKKKTKRGAVNKGAKITPITPVSSIVTNDIESHSIPDSREQGTPRNSMTCDHLLGDEFDSFGRIVTAHLRKLNPIPALRMQIKMQELMLQFILNDNN